MSTAPFGFGRLWPVVPAGLDDEATPVGLAPGQMPVDPRRDGSVQPTAAGKRLSSAVGGLAGGVAQGLIDAAKLPGDVYAGRIDPRSDQGIGRAFDLAGSLVTGGMPMAEAGAAGIFGGRLAATADREALKRAESMAASGADRRAIWDDTGWFQGPDTKWRFEIPDNAATYAPAGATKVGEALAHPGLAQAYPDVARLAFRQDDLLSRGANGAFSPTRGVAVDRTLGAVEGRPPVLHEAQHAVQRAEGFAGGANPRQFTQDAYADDLLSRWAQGAEPAADDIAQGAFPRWQQDQYRRTAGEVEARNVAARRDMTPEERRATPPWETQDVPDARQIVPGQPATGEQLAASSGPIRAFHGSPHDFDRFDVSMIGTGEGNQGFGRGLYFAGDERIARSYRDDLSRVPVLKFDGDAAGLNLTSPQNARDLAAFGFSTANGHLDAGLNNIRMMADFDPRLAPFAEEAAQHLRDGRVAMGPKSPGHMYEVAIDADPARLLDWDTPLARQSPAVRSFAGDRLADPQARAAIETAARQRLGGPSEVTGHDLYRGLTGYDDAAKAAVSADMQAAGIPGVQYLDTGSRGFGGGSQTRQYVTFGDDLVSVVRKYAAPGAVGAGGAAAAIAPDDTQAAPASSGAPMAFGFGSFSGLPADVLMRQRQGLPGALTLDDPVATMLGPDQTPARGPVAARPQQDQPVVAPFGFGALAPRMPASASPGMGFGPGSPGASLPLPLQEPAATGSTAPVMPPARPSDASSPSGGMTSAPLPPARPPEFGSSATPGQPLDIKPTGQATAAASSPSGWDSISNFLGTNSDMLIGIGTGLMSTPGFGRGLAAGVQQGVAMQNASAAQGLARAKQAVEMQKLAREQGGITANAGLLKRAYPGVTDEQATALAATPSNVQEALKILRDPNHGTGVPSGFRMRGDGQGYEAITGGPQDPATKERDAAATARGTAAGKPDNDDAVKREQRRQGVVAAGQDPNDPRYRDYILSGSLPKENQQALTAADKQAIREGEDSILSHQTALNSLNRALTLSPKAYEGVTAGPRATFMTNWPESLGGGGDAAMATREFDNLMSTQMLDSLKAIFGGNPTEGERAALKDIQGISSMPQELREQVIRNTIAKVQSRLGFEQARVNDLRGGTYYKPGREGPQVQAPAGAPAPQDAAPQGGQTPSAAGADRIYQPKSAEELAAMPSGARFIDPQGKMRVKP